MFAIYYLAMGFEFDRPFCLVSVQTTQGCRKQWQETRKRQIRDRSRGSRDETWYVGVRGPSES